MPLRHDGSGGPRSRRSSPPGACSLGERSPSTLPPPAAAALDESPPSDYSALDGATGRDVYFRPERYRRSELGGDVVVELHHAGGHFECHLQDVSQSGLAFEWPRGVPVEVGCPLDELVLRFDDHEAYRGRARVESVRRAEDGILVGASFTDTLMNIENVLHARDVKAWIAEWSDPGVRLAAAPWHATGQHRFRALVGELRLFLEDAKARFTELEAALPWHIVHGEQTSPGQEALVARIRSGFAADLVQAANAIDEALRGTPLEQRDALREYSVRHLHTLLMESPCMRRARYKPLGYAGDFEVMNFIYRGHFSGATLFAKALNVGFVSTPAAAAVRTRKDRIKACLAQRIERPEGRSSIRVLSIAAGPAQECFEVLQELERLEVPLEIVLFDQDKSALAYSYGRLKRLVAAKGRERIRVVHLQDSIKRLLLGTTTFDRSGVFDVVYANGLFDYLQPHAWVSLCRSLYELLAPGGTLYVGNMVPANPSRWVMELHLDWPLLYREREQMLTLARAAAPAAELAIVEEESGINPFVALTRP